MVKHVDGPTGPDRPARTHPLKVMDYIGGVAAAKVWHGHVDLFIVVVDEDADVLLQLLPASEGSVQRVLKHDSAVEQTVFWDLL